MKNKTVRQIRVAGNSNRGWRAKASGTQSFLPLHGVLLARVCVVFWSIVFQNHVVGFTDSSCYSAIVEEIIYKKSGLSVVHITCLHDSVVHRLLFVFARYAWLLAFEFSLIKQNMCMHFDKHSDSCSIEFEGFELARITTRWNKLLRFSNSQASKTRWPPPVRRHRHNNMRSRPRPHYLGFGVHLEK